MKKFIQQNPKTSGALFLIILTIVLLLFTIPELWLISLTIASRQLYKAKKANENKKFVRILYILMIIPVAALIVTIFTFAVFIMGTI